MRLGLALLGLLLLLAASTSSAAPAQPARIGYVSDGDTVVLANGEHVRLVQIDAPEAQEHECYGARASAALRRLAPPGSTVRVEGDPRLDDVDRYGRLLRYLFRGPTNLNLELVREGAATVWLYHHDRGLYSDALLRAALSARAAHRGLWGLCPRTPFDPYHAASTGPGGGSAAGKAGDARPEDGSPAAPP
jgi:endonuclease YncB( thermonuclease family)